MGLFHYLYLKISATSITCGGKGGGGKQCYEEVHFHGLLKVLSCILTSEFHTSEHC